MSRGRRRQVSLFVPPLALAVVIGLAIAGRDRPALPVVADATPASALPAPSPVPNVQAAAVPLPTPVRVLINGEHRNRFTVGEPMTARITSNFRADQYPR